MKIQQSRNNKIFLQGNSGSALFAVLMIVGILSLATAAFTMKISNAQKSAAGYRQRASLEIIRRSIMTNINCIESERATFTDPKYLNSAIEDRCKSTGTKQVAPYFRLKRYTYDGVMKLFENEEKVGNDVWQYIVGDYIVRASCSSEAPDHSLIVKAIPKGGKFKLTGKPIDWDSKEALIIGGDTAYEACVTPKFVDMDCSSRFSCSIYTPEISEQKKY